jgi:hypothetical protein
VRARLRSSSARASVIIDKRRVEANVAETMNVIGEVAGANCVIVDDIVDTAGTLVGTVKALQERGAARVLGCFTHAVLSGPAMQRIASSELEHVVVTDSIALSRIQAESQNHRSFRGAASSARRSPAFTATPREFAVRLRKTIMIKNIVVEVAGASELGKNASAPMRAGGASPASSTDSDRPPFSVAVGAARSKRCSARDRPEHDLHARARRAGPLARGHDQGAAAPSGDRASCTSISCASISQRRGARQRPDPPRRARRRRQERGGILEFIMRRSKSSAFPRTFPSTSTWTSPRCT